MKNKKKIQIASMEKVIEPARKGRYPKGIYQQFVSQVNDFIEKYRPVLEELSSKRNI